MRTMRRGNKLTTPAGQRWTRTKPTEDGWYWWQDQFWEPEVVEIYEVAGVLMVDSVNLDEATPLISWVGEWQGPISPNEATE